MASMLARLNQTVRQLLPQRLKQTIGQLLPQAGGRPAPAGPPPNERQLAEYGRLSRAAGIDRLYLYLTFDCDTDEDAEAALELDPWLAERGLQRAYAVPGVQLERSASAYRKLAAKGVEFLNHGGVPHAEWRGDRYHGITWYNEMTAAEVVADIRSGHETVSRIIGVKPKGFRAPHFGGFQAPDQLALIYGTARGLGYSYCTTTVPQLGLERGPVVDVGGLHEIPLFGSYLAPTTILDSWTYLEDRKDYRLGAGYFTLMRDTVDYMLTHDIPGVLAYYVDPAHVIGQTPFTDAMDLVRDRGIRSVSAGELIAMTGK
jgi:peptidoglycan/xylan/chitin deacetylase (PgdA/CDA1 family)